MNAFDSSITREERQAWFAHTPPWDRIASPVIDAILDGIIDKTLVEAFVQISMEQNLVTQYEPLGREIATPDVTRARLSQILCLAGNRAITSLAKTLETNDTIHAREPYRVAMNTFEAAIALAKNQVTAYAGISTVYGMISRRSESHEYAKRGLAELAEMRRLGRNFHPNQALPSEALDQMERYLQNILAW